MDDDDDAFAVVIVLNLSKSLSRKTEVLIEELMSLLKLRLNDITGSGSGEEARM